MKKHLLFAILMVVSAGLNNLFAQQRTPSPDPQQQDLLRLAEFFHQRHEQRKAEVEKLALENGWSIRTTDDGVESQIMYIDELGMPQSYITYNLNAAQTTGTNHLWTGGSLGLNLMGNGYVIGIWDGGGVRTTHQELISRVTLMDGASLSNHSTHVGGTMIASGVQNAARGMAQQAILRSYDWDFDYSEMTSQAAGGLTLSNHSYGWNRGWHPCDGDMCWWGTTSISTTEDYLFGFYDETARDLDIIAVNAPNYLVVWAAANDRNDTWSGGHWVRNSSGNWIWSTATRDPDGGSDGYDCIPQQGIAKNILTVGAVHDIPGGWTQASDVVMTTFSSWGPADDGRIKPDIVANGNNLYSSGANSNTHYYETSGTSMAAPNATGTLALLQEHYRNGRGGTMSAAALKGLVINTANEAGPHEGPDYMFGWGLLNATGSANLITNDNTDGGLIVQGLLVNGQTKDYTYYSDGSPVSVVLSWTDPAGTPPAASLNPIALMLENNLNLRVIGSSTHFPWCLNPASPAAAATRGDNFRDNVEKVTINNPTPGFYTIRINHTGSLTGGQQAYALIINGLKTPPIRTYCNSRSTNFNSFEHITRVQYGSIDNRSQRSPGGYSNYTGLVTNVNKGSNQTITVTITEADAGTWGRVYVDWNQDGDFNDAGETYTLGSGAGPTYSITINVPSTAYGGYTTMRVRLGWSGTPSACGTSAYGETEDYTIKVNGTAGLWTGIYDNNWFNMYNWDDVNVPSSSTNVVIATPASFQPTIPSTLFIGNAACNNLTIQAGGVLSMSGSSVVLSSGLNVYGNLNSDQGQFIMNNAYSYLYFRGSTNTWWDDDNENDTYSNVRIQKDSPTAVLSMWQNMTVNNSFVIMNGVFQIDANWTLTVPSTSTSAFKVQSGGVMNLSSGKTIDVSGRITFEDGSQANITGGIIRCQGDFLVQNNTLYNINLNGSTLVMNGSGSQYIRDQDGGNLQIHHLTVNKPAGTLFIGDNHMNINGNLTVLNGVLSAGNAPTPTNYYNINIKGDWANNKFPTGFVPGTARVKFNGTGHQYVNSSENFNILEANMVAALRVNNSAHTVTCQQYHWTSGGIDVIAGTFTANDLVQNGIYGGYWLNAGGTINLSNYGGWVDLNCNMNIFGGNFNIYGGTTPSYWPFLADATLNMSGGVLDFKNQGILINDTPVYSLNDNITGGIIRASGGFTGNRADFTPSAGTFEFYGGSDYTISQSNGCTLHDVVINKSAKEGDENSLSAPVYDKRSGELLSDGSKANTIYLTSDFTITGNLTVENGSLTLNQKTLNVNRNCYVQSTLNMTNAADVLNVGTYWNDWLEFQSGSTANVTNGTINCYGWIIPRTGSNFNLGIDNTVYLKGENSGGISNFEPSATYGNLVIAKNAGNYAVIDGIATEPVVINGDFTISADNTFRTQYNRMTVHGEFTDAASSVIQVLFGSSKGNEVYTSATKEPVVVKPGRTDYYLEIDSEFDLKGQLIINYNGHVYVHSRFSSSPGSSIKIDNGSFISDAPNHPDKGWQYLNGNLTLINGLFEITNNSVNFGGTATSSVSGGIIRTGGAFYATHTGVFQPSGGVVEITGSNPDGAIYCFNSNHFHNLTISRTGGYSQFMWGEPVLVQNNFIVNNGEIRSGASAISVLGEVAVNADGHLRIDYTSALLMGASSSINVNDGGLLEMRGDITNQPKISRISSGHYTFDVESGGTIAAEHALFEYMDNNGINIKPGAIVDHNKAFHNCIFRLGQSGGRLLTLNNSQTLAVNYASFPANTWEGSYNVSKTVNSGVVTFMGYVGDFAGATHEQDPNSRLHWGGQTAAMVTLQGVEVVPGQDICFEATNTLTVGGGGSVFEVHNGGFVELVAGQKISMLEGTHFYSGSYGLARITTTGDYCSLPAALIAATNETLTSIDEASENESGDMFFRVYPNPTTGVFNLEITGEVVNVIVEIYSMMGGQLLNQEVSGFMRYELDLSAQPRGVYIIRVHDGVKTGTQRIIRQ